MSVIQKYLSRGIEGFPFSTFEDILNDKHPEIKVRLLGKGSLFLSNSQRIKCAHDYYKKPEGEDKIPVKASNQCFYYQKALGITGVENYQCQTCHRQCLNLRKINKLKLR